MSLAVRLLQSHPFTFQSHPWTCSWACSSDLFLHLFLKRPPASNALPSPPLPSPPLHALLLSCVKELLMQRSARLRANALSLAF